MYRLAKFNVFLTASILIAGCGWLSETYREFVGFPHLDMAYRLSQQNKLSEARIEFEAYLEENPTDPEGLLAYIELLSAQGDYSQCEKAADRLLELQPSNHAARLQRARAFGELGQISSAIADYLEVAGTPQVLPEQRRLAWISTAELLRGEGRLEEARHILALVANETQSSQDDLRLARVEVALGKGEAAIETFQRALSHGEQGPESVEILNELSEVAASFEMEEQAIKSLKEAERFVPDSPVIPKRIAYLEEHLGNYDEALTWTRKWVSTEATPESRLYLIRMLVKAGLNGQVEAEIESWLRFPISADERAELLKIRARTREDLGDFSGAAYQYGEAYRLERKVSTLLAKAVAHERGGELEAAVECYLTAVSIREVGEYHYRLGVLYRMMKDPVRAFRHFSAALIKGLSPTLRADTYENLGYLYQDTGRHSDAANAFQEARRIRVPRVTVAMAHADSLYSAGKTDAALALIEDQTERERNPDQYQRMASWYLAKGNVDRAIDNLERAIALGLSGKALETAKGELGYLYFAVGRNEDALSVFYELLDAGGQSSDIWSSMGHQFHVEGDYEYAAYCFERSLDLQDDLAVALALSQSLSLLGRQEEADEVLRRRQPIAKREKGALGVTYYLELAESELRQGKPEQAARSFLIASELAGEFDWETLRRAFTAFFQARQWTSALQLGLRLLEIEGIPQRDQAFIWRTLGLVYAELGPPEKAIEAFQRVLDLELDDPSVRVSLALQLLASDRPEDALSHLQLAYQLEPNWERAQYLARAYEKLEKPGLAVHFLRIALADSGLRDAQIRRELWENLGFLAARQSNYSTAAQAWGMAVLLSEAPELRVKLARMLVLDGQLIEGERQLNAIDLEGLSKEAKAEFSDLRAEIALRKRQTADALMYRIEALRLAPTAERSFAVGSILAEIDRDAEAIDYLTDAVDAEPRSPAFLSALGYALYREGRSIEAAETLQLAVEVEPDYLQLYKDLGYVYLKNSDNRKSAEWFVRAIEAQGRGMAVLPGEEPLKNKAVTLREEVGRIRDWMDVWTYLSYRTRENGLYSPAFVPGAGAIPSQGGVELAVRPPGIGFRNQRILQFFGRVLWDLYPGSFRFNSESYQGSLGVRYKPFTTQNLFVGVEKLFRIGADAVNNFLLRTIYSWSPAAVRHPALMSRNYGLYYMDAAYSVQAPKYLSLYGELRQGVNLKLTDSLVLSPHAVADLRYLNHEIPWNSYYEIGGGASLRYYFNETNYETYRSDLELLLQYKQGRFWNGARSDENRSFGGVSFSMLFHF